jgi:hypothetical protein
VDTNELRKTRSAENVFCKPKIVIDHVSLLAIEYLMIGQAFSPRVVWLLSHPLPPIPSVISTGDTQKDCE